MACPIKEHTCQIIPTAVQAAEPEPVDWLSTSCNASTRSIGKFHTRARRMSTAARLDSRTKVGVCSMGTWHTMINMLRLANNGISTERHWSATDASIGIRFSMPDTRADMCSPNTLETTEWADLERHLHW